MALSRLWWIFHLLRHFLLFCLGVYFLQRVFHIFSMFFLFIMSLDLRINFARIPFGFAGWLVPLKPVSFTRRKFNCYGKLNKIYDNKSVRMAGYVLGWAENGQVLQTICFQVKVGVIQKNKHFCSAFFFIISIYFCDTPILTNLQK